MGRALTTVGASVLLGLAAGCGPVSVSQPPTQTLAQSIDSQVARQQALPWSAKRPLGWPDFRGTPPSGGTAVAETAYTLFHGASCTRSKFEFLVVAAFRPRDSWVKPSILKSPGDSARALGHEQTHFDIAELHARKMRRYFSEMMAPCRVPTDQLAAMAERFVRDEKAAQERYDDETSHSRDAVRQAAWDKDVASQLAGLGRFMR